MKEKGKKIVENAAPMMVSTASSATSTKTRRNVASTIERTNRFSNIDDGLVPFKYSSGGLNKSNIDVKEAVSLCQKAYYNFAIFRNVVDLMTEFSVSDIYFKGGNKKSRDFFSALFKKINIWALQDKFFREYYRSGNVFIYRFDANVSGKDALKITQVYADEKISSQITLPIRYVILNPADIQLGGSASFFSGKYYKVLTDYELARLRFPQTEEDTEIVNNLDEESRKKISSKSNSAVLLPLEQGKISSVFYKKQDYEPFSVPMGYPVLEDINWKAEMKKMDMAVARTMQQSILLVTMGSKPEDGGVNPKNLEAMQKLFENESVGRVLIADYTTKAEFVVPNIASLLDSKKYEVVERDIQQGLNNILVGDEKFSNQQGKIQVFIARLTQAREAFINEFVIPEIRRVSKQLGFKTYPIPYFDKVTLSEDTNMMRIYNRLVELGVLTPSEGINAIETGRLPDRESSIESQREFVNLKNEGLYDPLIGGKNTSENGAGRPVGVENVSMRRAPASNVSAKFSLSKVANNMSLAQELFKNVEGSLKKKHKLKKLSEEQKTVCEQIACVIISNETPQDWNSKIQQYLEKPIDQNPERISMIREIALQHQVDDYLASILHASIV
jgi:hypothetical protein